MEMSLNEVESLALKAGRGAGLPWGVAEDAGHRARWLAQRTDAWAASLLMLLEEPPEASRCPFCLGSFVADSAGAPIDRGFRNVAVPLWLIPALWEAAKAGICAVMARMAEIDVFCMSDGCVTVSPAWPVLEGLAQADLHIRMPAPRHAMLPCVLSPRIGRPRITTVLHARLEAYAAHTYVPATAESRLKGAGAGPRDDD